MMVHLIIIQIQKTKTMETIEEKFLSCVHMLIEKSDQLGDSDMYYHACDMIGQDAVVLYKIEKGLQLDDVDLEYVKKVMEQKACVQKTAAGDLRMKSAMNR